MLAEFGVAPNDASGSLREAIERSPSFKRGLAPGKRRSSLRTLLLSEPMMGARLPPVPQLRLS
jgi:hypothetical protein